MGEVVTLQSAESLLAMSTQWGRAESILENADRILESADSTSSPKAISIIMYRNVIDARALAVEVLDRITRYQRPVKDSIFNRLVVLGENIGRSFPIEPAYKPTGQFGTGREVKAKKHQLA